MLTARLADRHLDRGPVFASFLSWTALQLHKPDWKKLAKEYYVMAAVKKCDPPVGSYMFPACDSHAEMQTEAFKTKYAAGPLRHPTSCRRLKHGPEPRG